MYVTSQTYQTPALSTIKLNRRFCDDRNKLLIVNKLRLSKVQIPFFTFASDSSSATSSSTNHVVVVAPLSGLGGELQV